jgi:ATP-dependent Clp protease ATP-binding subunit ClpC
MFERYTEQARRVIFFSRYEASQLGSSEIENEHLLLGLIREDKALLCRVLTYEQLTSVRSAITSSTKGTAPKSCSGDLPLSLGSKLALKDAAEQSDQRSDRHIGTEHLLLGLLSQESSLAAQLLIQHGVTTERVFEGLKKAPSSERARTDTPKRRLNPPPPWAWPDAT